MAKQWIQRAVRKPGAFTAKAKRADVPVQAYAHKMRSAPGRTGKQARLAITLAKISKKRSARSKK